MKTKIFLCASLMLGLSLASCNDDDNYFISTDPVIDQSSVTTGSSDVTANSATLHGTVEGLADKSAAFYSVGFYYGEDPNSLTSRVDGVLDKNIVTATVNGLETGKTYYYQVFVSLKGQVSFQGEVKSFVTTNATVVTDNVQAVDFASATMGGAVTEAPADATVGVVISAEPDVEKVRAGLIVAAVEQAAAFSVEKSGLVPGTKYYYAAYLDLGSGVIYGDVKEFTTDAKAFDADADFVDLGLSVKWAKSNIGAKSESDLGGLFGFGDLTGVNNSYHPEDYASGDIYRTKQDLAWNVTGGVGTLPTYQDYEELFANCTSEWTEVDGVAGYRLTGPNGNSIFLPAAGTRTVSDINSLGIAGYYATGSSNNGDFYYAYQFSSSNRTRASLPVYQAAAVRAISTARNIPFDKTKLYGKWYMENGQDGKLHVFEGPFTQFGVTDNWNTITNNHPNVEQQIGWEMGTNNGWIGYTYGKDYGYMEFLEDGTVSIHRIAEDGTVTDETGHYTIDEKNVVLNIDIDILCGNTWLANKSGSLKILALDNDGLRIAIPDGDYGYAVNYYSERKREFDDSIPVNFQCVGGDWNGEWGSVCDRIDAENLEGKHTVTYNGTINGAMVFNIDFKNLVAKYPDAIVYINDIRCDDKSIKFDANKFFYGDIEDNGNYRIELFNIWGKGQQGGKVVESPFSAATNVESDPAFSVSSKLEIDYTITLNPAYFTPGLITVNSSWYEPTEWAGVTDPSGASFKFVVDENNKIAASKKEFDITIKDGAFAGGSIMTFVNTPELMNVFPGTQMTLTGLEIDGNAVTGWDPAKVANSDDGDKHRLELWNCYGVTSKQGCAFGTPQGDVLKELGFTDSIRVKFTVDTPFKPVVW